MGKQIDRKCWHCFASLEPTEETFATCRMFKCPECDARMLWHDDPKMDGSHAEKHKLKNGGFDCLSMMSDPECDVMQPRRYPPAPGPKDRKLIKIDGQLFKWHKGRERWIKWDSTIKR